MERLLRIISFLLLINPTAFSQMINNEKLFHFSLNGPNDTLDLIQGIRLSYLDGFVSSDTNRFGELNSAVRLNGAYFEILNEGVFNLDEDSAVMYLFG